MLTQDKQNNRYTNKTSHILNLSAKLKGFNWYSKVEGSNKK